MAAEDELTAYHEAAHAVVACSVGRMVTEATIIPEPPSQYAPGSLGHVCLTPLVDPRPVDLWLDCMWVEHQVMVWLAGYLVEDVLFPVDDPMRLERADAPTDHGWIAALLRVIAPTKPDAAVAKVRQLRRKCFDLLELPGQIEAVQVLAERLLEVRSLRLDEIYQLLNRGSCGAIHPFDPSMRCQWGPHAFGYHWAFADTRPGLEGEIVKYDGLPEPDPRLKVSAMPGNLKRVRALIRGGAWPRLPRAWQPVLDACNEMPALS